MPNNMMPKRTLLKPKKKPDILARLLAFAEEADADADGFSDIGEDDNSYDAGGLSRDADDMGAQVRDGKSTVEEAEAWLLQAREQLNNLG